MKTLVVASALSLSAVLGQACEKDKNPPSGLVVDASAPVATATASAPTTDLSQCPGCQLAPTPSWTFEGIYADAACTKPIAQTVTPSCAAVPALGAASLTYVDDVGLRKAGETANVTLAEVAAGPRFRKAGTKCVKANEGGTAITPPGCANNKVCRDASGGLVCANCRTFANGCPDVIETRTYAAISDPGLESKPGGGGGGGNLANLRACCNALSAQAKAMGASPEAGVIASAAAQCLALVAAAGPSGNAPELGALKTLLAGRNVPAICAGL